MESRIADLGSYSHGSARRFVVGTVVSHEKSIVKQKQVERSTMRIAQLIIIHISSDDLSLRLEQVVDKSIHHSVLNQRALVCQNGTFNFVPSDVLASYSGVAEI
jgi:hypothetical protein